MNINTLSTIPDTDLDVQPPFPTNRINFLPTKVGKEHTFIIKLTNSFDFTLTMTAESTSDQFQVLNTKITLKPGEKKSFGVTFKPTKPGTWSGMIIFTYQHNGERRFFTVNGKAQNSC